LPRASSEWGERFFTAGKTHVPDRHAVGAEISRRNLCTEGGGGGLGDRSGLEIPLTGKREDGKVALNKSKCNWGEVRAQGGRVCRPFPSDVAGKKENNEKERERGDT